MKRKKAKKIIVGIVTLSMLISNQTLGMAVSSGSEVVEVKENDGWQLVWNDEFDGDTLDLNKWSYQTGNGYQGWGNGELQYYTKDAVSVGEGTLKITAKEEQTGGYKYTSGRIRTVTDDGKKLFGAKYGRFEARIKMPEGQGLWPAFWMMPVDSEYGNWPLSGEIDIMEARGRVTNKVAGTIHFGESRPFNRSLGGDYTFSDDEDITGFHVYSVEWNENSIIWFVDGVEYYRTSNWYTEKDGVVAEYPAPFNKEFYLILNMAVGGNYDNYISPDGENLPAEMEVDYVRVYQKNQEEKANVTMPQGTRDDLALAGTPVFENGNLLSNLDNVNERAITSTYVDYSENSWKFMAYELFGAAAGVEKMVVDSGTFVKTNIVNPGNAAYGIQLKHLLPLAEGYVYNISFDAKCVSGAKNIKVKPLSSSGRGSVNFAPSYTAALTENMQHFEYSFMMKEKSDMKAMIEFNLGGTAEDVILGNISVNVKNTYVTSEKTDEEIVTEEISENELITEKIVTNETKEEVIEEETTKQVVTENETTKEETTEETTVEETTEETTVEETTEETTEETAVEESKEETTEETTVEETTEEETKVEETTEEETTEETTEEVVEEETEEAPTEVIEASVVNGDFANGLDYWGAYGENVELSLSYTYKNSLAKIAVTPKNNIWDTIFYQKGVKLTKGHIYKLSFDIKCSSSNQKFGITLDDENYGNHLARVFNVDRNWKNVLIVFEVDTDEELIIKYMLGSVSKDSTFYIDNVSIVLSE